jgi:hypothetical protein
MGECEFCTDAKTTLHFIRAELANIMDIEKLKEYVRGLV